jgi:hypothetical protein
MDACASIRRGGDLENFFHRSHVGSAGFEGLLEHLVLLGLLGIHLNHPAAVEHPGDAAGRAHPTTLLLEDVPDLGSRAVLVVREHPNQHRHSTRSVAFVRDVFVLLPRASACALLDGTLDVVGGHVRGLGGFDRRLEAHIGLGVAPAVLGGHRDLAEDLGEELPSLYVRLALLALDLGPPRMSGHGLTFPLDEWML